MFNMLINCIKGVYTIEVKGRFPERILNKAAVSGIYLYDIKRKDEQTLVFSTGKKGYEKLGELNVEGLTVKLNESYGSSVFFKKYKKRIILFLLPVIFLLTSLSFSSFIWKIEIEGGDSKLQKEVLDVISRHGVYRGALKHKISQYEVKYDAILKIDDLSWMWVDIKGTTAKVKIRKRTPKPSLIPINEPSDVIAMHSGIIDSLQTYCGVPLVKEGDSVEKGDVLVTGIFRSENENIPTYYHHACANIILRLAEEKAVIIPKKTPVKTLTGKEKSKFGINFKKNHINFSLNSGISYKEYDKIEKKYALSFLPFSFSKITYREARVEYIETDIEKEIENRKKVFLAELKDRNMQIVDISTFIEEKEDSVKATFSAECLVRTDKEIPIVEISNLKGESDGNNY